MIAPQWELRVNDQPLPRHVRRLISAVHVDATVDGADEVAIEAAAFDPVRPRSRIVGSNVLAPGNFVVVRMGYEDGQMLVLQRFQLVREEATYPQGAHPVVVFRGYSAEHRLVEHTGARKFGAEVPDHVIAQQIAEDAGIAWNASTITATPQRSRARVKPKGETDWKFLRGLASANDFGPPIVRYDPRSGRDLLIFRPTDLDLQPFQLRFVYNPFRAGAVESAGSLLSFSPTLSLSGVPTAVRVTGWDPEQQAPIAVEVALTPKGQTTTVYRGGQVEDLPPHASGSELYVRVLATAPSGRPDRTERVSVATVETTEGALAFAERWLRTRNRAFQIARAKAIGHPAVWVGEAHRFEGLAPTHDGLYDVRRVRHSMTAQGYTLDLDLVRVIEETVEER